MSKRGGERGVFWQSVWEPGDQEIVKIVKLALRLARPRLADYAHKFAPKKFTHPQLFACLLFKAHMAAPIASARGC